MCGLVYFWFNKRSQCFMTQSFAFLLFFFTFRLGSKITGKISKIKMSSNPYRWEDWPFFIVVHGVNLFSRSTNVPFYPSFTSRHRAEIWVRKTLPISCYRLLEDPSSAPHYKVCTVCVTYPLHALLDEECPYICTLQLWLASPRRLRYFTPPPSPICPSLLQICFSPLSWPSFTEQ